MRRIIGLLLLVRAFTPLLLILICLWAGSQMLADLQTAVAPSVRVINNEIASIQAAAAEAEAQFTELTGYVETAVSTLQRFSLPDLSLNLPANFTLPSVNIPDVTISVPSSVSVQFTSISGEVSRAVDDCSNIPVIGWFCDGIKYVTDRVNVSYPSGISVGTSPFRINMPTLPGLNVALPNVFGPLLNELNTLLDTLTSVFDVFEPAIASVTRLGEATQDLAATFDILVTLTEQIIAAIQAVLLRYSALLLLAAIGIGVLLVLIYTGSFLSDLARGWALLTGPASLPTQETSP